MSRNVARAPLPPRSNADELLTVKQVLTELGVSRSTFYDWRAKGRAPRCSKLPNGKLRIARRDLDAWYEACQVA